MRSTTEKVMTALGVLALLTVIASTSPAAATVGSTVGLILLLPTLVATGIRWSRPAWQPPSPAPTVAAPPTLYQDVPAAPPTAR